MSHRTWRTQLGADPTVIGHTVRMGGQPVTVIGIGPEGFNGGYAPLVTDYWLSISAAGVGGPFRIANLERRQDHWYDVRARLAPGVTVVQAQGAMDALAARLADEFPDLNRGRGITVFGGGEGRVHPAIDGALAPAAGLLLGIVGLVLVLAVLLASVGIYAVVSFSVAGRSQEIGIRIALGAERSQVIGFVMREMLATVLIGLAVGTGLALPAALPLAPALYEVSTFPAAILGLGALLLAAVATLATYIPARRSAIVNPVATLRVR